MKVPIQKLRRYNLRGAFSHHKTFGSATIAPLTLGRAARYVRDQKTTNYCTAAARSLAGSFLYGKEMSFEYMTAKEGEIAGQPIFNGSDPGTADLAIPRYGFLPMELSPFSFATNGWATPAIWQNYPPELDGIAILNCPGTPYNVYPDYQSIKAALVAAADQGEDAIVVANGFWYNEWNYPVNGQIVVPFTSPMTRHSYTFIDYRTFPDGIERLVAQLSQGRDFGEDGLVYMDEATVNKAFKYPSLNGLGCTISRKQGALPIQTHISQIQAMLMKLGELLDKLRGL